MWSEVCVADVWEVDVTNDILYVKRRKAMSRPWILEPGDRTPDSKPMTMNIQERHAEEPVEIYVSPTEKRQVTNRRRVGF